MSWSAMSWHIEFWVYLREAFFIYSFYLFLAAKIFEVFFKLYKFLHYVWVQQEFVKWKAFLGFLFGEGALDPS
jgi:hypothetical protein